MLIIYCHASHQIHHKCCHNFTPSMHPPTQITWEEQAAKQQAERKQFWGTWPPPWRQSWKFPRDHGEFRLPNFEGSEPGSFRFKKVQAPNLIHSGGSSINMHMRCQMLKKLAFDSIWFILVDPASTCTWGVTMLKKLAFDSIWFILVDPASTCTWGVKWWNGWRSDSFWWIQHQHAHEVSNGEMVGILIRSGGSSINMHMRCQMVKWLAFWVFWRIQHQHAHEVSDGK